jgi:hypothetical protein
MSHLITPLSIFRFILWILLIASRSPILFSQDIKYTKVSLKDGSVLIGELKTYKLDSALVLEFGQKDVTIPATMIKKMEMVAPNLQTIKQPFSFKKKWYHETKVSAMLNEDDTKFSIAQSLYFTPLKNLFVGGGIGVENYVSSSEFNIIPIFSATKYYFASSKFSPFVGAKLGYGSMSSDYSTITKDSHGGLHSSFFGGFRLTGPEVIFEIFGGIKKQSIYIEKRFFDQISQTNLLARRLELGLILMY